MAQTADPIMGNPGELSNATYFTNSYPTAAGHARPDFNSFSVSSAASAMQVFDLA